jgi:hypothetical protein
VVGRETLDLVAKVRILLPQLLLLVMATFNFFSTLLIFNFLYLFCANEEGIFIDEKLRAIV